MSEQNCDNDDRVSGTVWHASAPQDKDVLGRYYVIDQAGERWVFWNTILYLGTTYRSYVYDQDDMFKQRGHDVIQRTQTLLRLGDRVTFVPKRTEELMRNDKGILVETFNPGQTRSFHDVTRSWAEPPPFAAGMAVGVALDAAKNAGYVKRVHKPLILN